MLLAFTLQHDLDSPSLCSLILDDAPASRRRKLQGRWPRSVDRLVLPTLRLIPPRATSGATILLSGTDVSTLHWSHSVLECPRRFSRVLNRPPFISHDGDSCHVNIPRSTSFVSSSERSPHEPYFRAVASQASRCSTFVASADVVTTTSDSGSGSLYQAIEDVDSGLVNTIDFAISGSGIQVIYTGGLPTITEPVTIDGTSQSGYSGSPLIELNGSDAPSGTTGLTLATGSNGSTILGLYVTGFSNDGIDIIGSYDTIGGAPTGGNVLSGNGNDGISIDDISGYSSDDETVQGNIIGLDVTGTAALGNGANGIELVGSDYGILDSTIGGTSEDARNLISGNDGGRIQIDNGGSNLIVGNYIGTDASGGTAVPNENGIVDSGGAENEANTIGGSEGGAGNLISGNTDAGITITNAPHIEISTNSIGTTLDGTDALANAVGIVLDGDANFVDVSNNLVSGNTGDGVRAENITACSFEGNTIGLDQAGSRRSW